MKTTQWFCCMLLMMIVGFAGDAVLPHTRDIGLLLLWAAALLTLYTGWDYLRAGFKHVVEE